MRLNLESLEVRENPAVVGVPRVPPALVQQFISDARVLVEGATAPSPQAAAAFITTTWNAFADGRVSTLEVVQIVQTAQVVLAESNVTVAQLSAVIVDVQAIRAALR